MPLDRNRSIPAPERDELELFATSDEPNGVCWEPVCFVQSKSNDFQGLKRNGQGSEAYPYFMADPSGRHMHLHSERTWDDAD